MGTPHVRSSSGTSSVATSEHDAPPAAAESFVTTDTRIDPPHVDDGGDDPIVASDTPPTPGAEASELFDPEAVETLRNQARQLSVLLRERRDDLDRREAEWQRQTAHFENESRAGRLWLNEQRRGCDERDAALTTREQELESRLSKLAEAETAIAQLHCERDEAASAREQSLLRRETELDDLLMRTSVDHAAQRAAMKEIDARREELDREREAVRRENDSFAVRREELQRLAAAPSTYQLQLQSNLDEREAALAEREQALDEQELRLRDGLIEVERLNGELREERERQSLQEQRNRMEVAQQQRRLEAEIIEKQKAFARQSEQLDFRRAAVRQEQADLSASQRETLEMRIAVEELWTQLAGSVPPAVLTENLARIRGKLAEQYRLQQHELNAQRAELESLRADLATESERLRVQTVELRRWADARHEEIERQAAFLTAREQELEHQDAEHLQRSLDERHERTLMEHEIRRLQNDLRRAGVAA